MKREILKLSCMFNACSASVSQTLAMRKFALLSMREACTQRLSLQFMERISLRTKAPCFLEDS